MHEDENLGLLEKDRAPIKPTRHHVTSALLQHNPVYIWPQFFFLTFWKSMLPL